MPRQDQRLPKGTYSYPEDEDDSSYYGSDTDTESGLRSPPSTRRTHKKVESNLIDKYYSDEDEQQQQQRKNNNMTTTRAIDDDFSDASSLPPPPPPPEGRKSSLFRSSSKQGGGSDTVSRKAFVYEEQDESFEAQDITKWPSSWNRPSRSNPNRRKLCMGMACLLVLCAIVGVLVGVTRGNNNQVSQSNSFSKIEESPEGDNGGDSAVGGDGSPEDSQGDNSETPDSEGDNSETDVDAPEPDPEEGDEDEDEDEDTCSDHIDTNKDCYGLSEIVWVGFTNCDAKHDDWIGIYNVDNIFDMYNLGPSHSMWLWTCEEEEIEECHEGDVLKDVLPFGGGLPEGTYQAFLVRTNEFDEYVSHAHSGTFEFSDSC